ncbi:MAG: citramalate synthase [Alphaproteobacteria bacterium]|jgi:hydroxymethylglutaryl-CoA lyase|nr:citramalate synthase [Rhodospirillaceae bacterium]MDP6020830.1 citramalate synthase [Alphaproteobacteria bacterium]MDP6256859.1 citramalate synthase [Alphaproteobacteria bacterium]MDP7054563.1 citramalate synthase [Alphaproteobacteria bacterium]MDP7227076.1 citramalate synthase [Alphaproteobacteria bacterium]|tara:strand:+ start:4263 stop:5462 length:1200 start_codon:yes stop_codon:yes gene_type:complete
MAGQYPTILYTEEGLREGMQIEDQNIPVDAKVELLDALSETGLKEIVVGSFVSPKYTPQMERIDEIVSKFTPKPGVTYTALALNARGIERAKEYSPPLTLPTGTGRPSLRVHQCDVFARRNTNRSQMQEMAAWEGVIRDAVERGAKEAGIGTNATFGSNFVGDFSVDMTLKFLEKQHALWDAVGIKVTALSIGDPMGWCHPVKVEQIFGRAKQKWPEIKNFNAHLHNSRGMAVVSSYAAINALDGNDTLRLQGTIGGIGGCPYCGNGRATSMAPTEDFMHMLEGMGIETGVDLDKLIDCVWMLEKMIDRYAWGHVSRAGPRPMKKEQFFDANAPFVETVEQAKHFKLGPDVYEGCIYPWNEPIASPYLDRVQQGLLPFEADGAWPWEEEFFPKPRFAAE